MAVYTLSWVARWYASLSLSLSRLLGNGGCWLWHGIAISRRRLVQHRRRDKTADRSGSARRVLRKLPRGVALPRCFLRCRSSSECVCARAWHGLRCVPRASPPPLPLLSSPRVESKSPWQGDASRERDLSPLTKRHWNVATVQMPQPQALFYARLHIPARHNSSRQQLRRIVSRRSSARSRSEPYRASEKYYKQDAHIQPHASSPGVLG